MLHSRGLLTSSILLDLIQQSSGLLILDDRIDGDYTEVCASWYGSIAVSNPSTQTSCWKYLVV